MDSPWWVGTNGNLFCDFGKYRYCIEKVQDGYSVMRNGVEIAVAPNSADAKLFAKRDSQE